ncbi:MAG: SH3 domain-containing protein [Acidobacteriota bacterium]
MTIRLLKLAMILAVAYSMVGGQTVKTVISEDGTKLLLGNRVLLDAGKDGFMSIKQVKPAPDGKRFAVVACGYECNDNVGFVFNADGRGKRKFTARWDYILQDKIEWSADGKRLYYFRINSTGADPQVNAPTEGWIEVDAATVRKAKATSRTLKSSARYAVFNVAPNDSLNVREAPSLKAGIAGKLPHNAGGIQSTGEKRTVGQETWVKIRHETLTGWVNQSYLYEQAPSTNQNNHRGNQ